MGCLCTKDLSTETVEEVAVPEKIYSWDEKKKLYNAEDFIVENLNEQEVVKLPGSVNGQQFIIQNCKNSFIYILDHINTITIDDCVNCNIVLGPVEGSTFIRNCLSCNLVVACGQFRVRDSTKINAFLYSATQPIIEASSGIHFGTYQLKYNGIQEHFQKCNLNSKIKNWEFIHDFTPMDSEENWDFMKNDSVSQLIPDPNSETVKDELKNLDFTWSSLKETESVTENKS